VQGVVGIHSLQGSSGNSCTHVQRLCGLRSLDEAVSIMSGAMIDVIQVIAGLLCWVVGEGVRVGCCPGVCAGLFCRVLSACPLRLQGLSGYSNCSQH
jgi:hypothetical protein